MKHSQNTKQEESPPKEQRQERKTMEDTLDAQEELLHFIWLKRKNNDWVHMEEQNHFTKLIAHSILTTGNWRQAVYEDGNNKILLGPFHVFLLNLRDIHRNRVIIERFSYHKEVDIKVLWQIALDELKYLFPAAMEESWMRSQESFKGGAAQSYDFSVSDK